MWSRRTSEWENSKRNVFCCWDVPQVNTLGLTRYIPPNRNKCIPQGERIACVAVCFTTQPHEQPHTVFGGFTSHFWRMDSVKTRSLSWLEILPTKPCSTKQRFNMAWVLLLVSLCCDTAQALVLFRWCQCVVTQPRPWCCFADVSVLWHSLSLGVLFAGVSVLWHSPSLGVLFADVSVLWHSPSLGVLFAGVSVLWHSPSLGVLFAGVSVLWQP